MATVAVLNVAVKAQTTAFRRGMMTATKLIKQFGGTVAGILGGISFKGFLNQVDNIAQGLNGVIKTARQLNITADALISLEVGAQKAGVEVGSLHTFILRLQKAVAAARSGKGAEFDALARLGLSAAELARMRPEAQLGAIGDKMAGLADHAERVLVATKLFGRGGGTMVAMLANGTAGINALRQEADRLNLTIGDDGVRAVQDYAKEIGALKRELVGLKRAIALPVIRQTSELLASIRELRAARGKLAEANAMDRDKGVPARGFVGRLYDRWDKFVTNVLLGDIKIPGTAAPFRAQGAPAMNRFGVAFGGERIPQADAARMLGTPSITGSMLQQGIKSLVADLKEGSLIAGRFGVNFLDSLAQLEDATARKLFMPWLKFMFQVKEVGAEAKAAWQREPPAIAAASRGSVEMLEAFRRASFGGGPEEIAAKQLEVEQRQEGILASILRKIEVPAAVLF